MFKDPKMLDWYNEFSNDAEYKALKNKLYENEMELIRELYRLDFARKSTASLVETYLPTMPCDEKYAEELLEKGNKFVDDPATLQLATALYTRAIYKSPTKSAVLSIAHANRAKALMKLSEFEVAYDDCMSALQFDHPKPFEILQRQATICCKLQDTQKFKVCIQRLQELNVDATPFVNEYFIASKADSLSKKAFSSQKRVLQESEKKTRIVRSRSGFRSIVADEDIGINEHVISDTADVIKVDDQFRQNFLSGKDTDIVMFVCDYCTEQDIVPFPCYECRRVFYCSRKCCQDDFYVHRYECTGYKERFLGNTFPFQLSIRCLLTGFGDVLSVLWNSGERNVCQSAEELWPTLLKTFTDGHIFGLHRNFQHFQENYSTKVEGMLAMLSCQYLAMKTDFFKHTEKERSAYLVSEMEWQIIVTTILLRCQCQLELAGFSSHRFFPLKPFTTQSISETGLFNSVRWFNSGAAMCGRVGLINHSCEANCILKFDKRKLIFISRTPIAKGDEITFDYLGNSALLNYNERRNYFLENMQFLCHCERCKDDLLFIQTHQILCECGAKVLRNVDTILCPKCGMQLKAESWLQILANFNTFMKCVEKNNIFHEIYGILKILVPKTSSAIWELVCYKILFTYLSSEKNKEYLNNANINEIMIGIATYFLELSENSYTRSLTRASFAQMLLELITIRKKMGRPLSFPYYSKDKIKQTFWILGEKEKKWFEMICDKYLE